MLLSGKRGWVLIGALLAVPFAGIIGLLPISYEWYCRYREQVACTAPLLLDSPFIGVFAIIHFLETFSGIVAAGAAIVAAVYASRLWGTTEKQAQISAAQTNILDHQTEWMKRNAKEREDFEKSRLRARIRVAPITDPVEVKLAGGACFELAVQAMNIGETAASDVRISHQLRVIPFGNRVGSVRGNYHLTWPTNNVLAAGEKSKAYPEAFPEYSIHKVRIQDNEYQEYLSGKKRLGRMFCWGYVRFEDVFEDRWSQEFCWEIDMRTGMIIKTGYGSNKEIFLNDWDPKGALASEENSAIMDY